MSKSIQSSFAARIGKAETLFNTINGFSHYEPGDEKLKPNGLRASIDKLYSLQDEHAERYNTFTTAVQSRQALFSGTVSLSKTMTMTKSYVTAVYGKNSDKAKNVDTIVTKIRGEKPTKITTASGENSISRSEKSYGAQHVNLLYLIKTITGFGTEYTPANQSITVQALTTLADKIKAANDEAVIAYQAFHPLVISRQESFMALAAQVQRIKQMVHSQYGSGSVEYKSIKGLSF